MNKKLLGVVISLVLVVSLFVGGTIAYLTDRDSEANVFTVGNVSIDLTEDFEQGAQLVPGEMIEKTPLITNTGINDAWVWMTVALPAGLEKITGDGQDGSYQNFLHWNVIGSTYEGVDNSKYVEGDIAKGVLPEGTTAEYIRDNNATWDVTTDVKAYTAVIKGVEYNVYTLLYNKALTPREITLPSVYQFYFEDCVDIAPDGTICKVENGVVTKSNWNINKNGAPIVYVSAYAIQTEGFATVNAAYAAYNEQWTTDPDSSTSGAPVNNGTEWADVTVAAPESGTVRPAGYAPAEGGEIDGLVIVDGSDDETNLRALYANDITDDLTVNNSYLDGTYAMNVTTKTEGLTLSATGTDFRGWVSYSGWETATFTDCTFDWNSEHTYNTIRPYDTTVFTNCEFSGTEFWLDKLEGAKITLVNCTLNGVAITSADQLNIVYGDAESVEFG